MSLKRLKATEGPWADVPAPRDISEVETIREAQSGQHDPRCKWANTQGRHPCNCAYWAGSDSELEEDGDDWEH